MKRTPTPQEKRILKKFQCAVCGAPVQAIGRETVTQWFQVSPENGVEGPYKDWDDWEGWTLECSKDHEHKVGLSWTDLRQTQQDALEEMFNEAKDPGPDHYGGPGHRIEYRHTGTAPNATVLLRIFHAATDILLAEVDLGCPMGAAQACMERIEIPINLKAGPGTRRSQTLLTRVRKGLGYSYPEQ